MFGTVMGLGNMFCNSSLLSQIPFSSILRSTGKSENRCKVKHLDLQEITIFHPFVFCTKHPDGKMTFPLLILLSVSKPVVTHLIAYFKNSEMAGGSTEGTWQEGAVDEEGVQ